MRVFIPILGQVDKKKFFVSTINGIGEPSFKIFELYCVLAIYGPMIYTAPYVMLLTRASGRGLGPGNRDFFGPCATASSC
jgi:hypothetical protein